MGEDPGAVIKDLLGLDIAPGSDWVEEEAEFPPDNVPVLAIFSHRKKAGGMAIATFRWGRSGGWRVDGKRVRFSPVWWRYLPPGPFQQ